MKLKLETLESRDTPSITFTKGVLEIDFPQGGGTVIANPTSVVGAVDVSIDFKGYDASVIYRDVLFIGVKAGQGGGVSEFIDNSYVNDGFNGTLGTDNIYVGSHGEINGCCTGSGSNTFTTRSYGEADILLQGGYGTIVTIPTANITGNRTGYTITF